MKFPESSYSTFLHRDVLHHKQFFPGINLRRRKVAEMLKVANEYAKQKQRIDSQSVTCTSALGDVSVQPHMQHGAATQRRIFYLRTSGCTWSKSVGGGCTMCGHLSGMDINKTISDHILIKEFKQSFNQYDYEKCRVVALYNGGSFLSSSELKPSVRDEILATVAAEPNVELIIIESLAELVTKNTLASVRRAVGDKRLQIGVGFESRNDDVRSLCINKRNSLQEYISAFNNMAEYDVESLVYCLMKPLFLDESSAIRDTIDTINFAFGHGVLAASIEPVSVQDNTLVELFHRQNLYRTPWTWSLMEVIKKTSSLGDVRAGGFEIYPRPKETVHNCPKCDEECYHALEQYNATGKAVLFDALHCECKTLWYRALESNHEGPLVDTAHVQLNHFNSLYDIAKYP